jgi:hypothetical protein
MRLHLSHGRRGVTLTETLVSFGITAFIMSFTAYLTFLSGRNTINIHQQILGQTSASRAAERSVYLMRNAHHYAPVQGDVPAETMKRILMISPPGSAAATTQVLAFHSERNELQYYKDASDVSFDEENNPVGEPTLRFRHLSGFNIGWESEFRLRMRFSFQYSGFAMRLHNPSNPQYGQFITDVIAKNHHIDKGSENYGKADDPSLTPFML